MFINGIHIPTVALWLAGAALAMAAASWIARRLALRTLSIDGALLEADLLLTKGLEAYNAKDFTLARERYERSLALYPRHRNHLAWAKGHHQMGNVYFEKRKFARAIRWHLKCVTICSKHGLRQVEASSWYWLGTIHQHRLAIEEAFEAYQRSLVLARETGSRKEIANALWGMGVTRMFEGDFNESIRYLEQALEVERLPPANLEGMFQCLSGILTIRVFMMDFAGADQALLEMTTTAGALGGAEYMKDLEAAAGFIREARGWVTPFPVYAALRNLRRETRASPP